MEGKAVPDHNRLSRCDVAWERIDAALRILTAPPWLTQLVIRLLSIRPDFSLRLICVTLKVALGQVFLQFSLVSIIPPLLHTDCHLLLVWYIIWYYMVYYSTVDGITFHTFLTCALDGGEQTYPHPSGFTLKERAPQYLLNRWALLPHGCFFNLVQQPPVGQGLLIHEVSRLHLTQHSK
jgi:hypothetical protein